MTGEPEPSDPVERVVELGILARGEASEAHRRFQREARDVNFASFLLEQGLIGLDQFARVQPVHDGDATLVGLTVTKVGQRFGGCRIEEKLGSGAMGSVYRAVREEDGASVVVKFLDAALAEQRNSRARFVRTGELVQQVDHPNVAAVYSVHDDPDQPPCLVMELVDGEPLGERLLREGRFTDAREVIAIARQVALGLAAAHALGIIHRDVKPDNVLVTKTGEVKLIDFGLAKNTRRDEGLSVFGQVLGTPYYMAPEQWGERGVDARSDLFSLGSTLYHLLTGQLPFEGKRPLDVAHKILRGAFARPRDVVAELPADLEHVLLRMLETDPGLRYGDALELATDLQRLEAGEPPNLPRLESDGEPVLVRRFPLLPGKQFTVGRKRTNDLALKHETVSREHARLDRLARGYVLRDQGSTYGTFVRDMRVREVVLEDGDRVRFGEVPFTFHSGQRRKTSREVHHIPEGFLEALAAEGDRRTVMALVETLAPATLGARVELARRQLTPILSPKRVRAAATHLQQSLTLAKARAADRLAKITKNKVAGTNADAWLSWWGESWTAFPPQLGPLLPSLRIPGLRVLAGEERARFPLPTDTILTIGRDERSAIRLTHRSVSRLHATILRLDQRLVVRDEGSRGGTALNGASVDVAFLRAGDRLALGEVELEVEEPQTPAPAVDATLWIEPQLFGALLEVAPEATAAALAHLARADAWFDAEATRIAPSQPRLRARLVKAVRATRDRWLQRGGRVDATGVQVFPTGWGLDERRVELRRPGS